MAGFTLRGLGKFKRELKDVIGTFQQIGMRRDLNGARVLEADRWIERNFQTEGSTGLGHKWDQLQPKTKNKRRRGKDQGKKRSFKILQDKGWMKNLRKHFYSARSAVIEFGLLYANVHQFGSTAKNIPAREFLPGDDARGIEKIDAMAWKSYMRSLDRRGFNTARLLR